jgi:hypothetical protein
LQDADERKDIRGLLAYTARGLWVAGINCSTRITLDQYLSKMFLKNGVMLLPRCGDYRTQYHVILPNTVSIQATISTPEPLNPEPICVENACKEMGEKDKHE